MARDDRRRGRSCATKGDVYQVEIKSQPELLACQMRLGSDASMPEAELAFIRADVIDQFSNRVRGNGWIDDKHRRRCGCKCNRCEVSLRIETWFGNQTWANYKRPEYKQNST